jgi:uncharacterized protein
VRVLFDSSILIAAYISPAGICASLLEHVLMEHELIISDFIVDEVTRKLRSKFAFPVQEVTEVRKSILSVAQRVSPAAVPVGSCRDPNDLPVLGTAVAGATEIIVSVDKDLLTLGAFEGIPIVRPGDFWRAARASG